ncbi:hypothetical protein EV361DRAFT_981640 [Lentinula raphanica]|nr:hypothetical protein EV361DRAFT_981640 [Lentinula raphanica]
MPPRRSTNLDLCSFFSFLSSFKLLPPPTFSKVAVFESFLRSPRFFLGSLSLHVDEINLLDDRELYDHIGRGNVRERRFMGRWLSIDWVCWLESPSGEVYALFASQIHRDLTIRKLHKQYTHLFEGNPREVASLIGADENSLPGVVCGTWTEFKIIGNSNPGTYEFNCVPTPDEIDANAHNNGFFIGGLNHEGVTMALCHIEYSGNELCDSDTVSDANDEACNVWVVCE